jgi:preprotein translocase subunit SecG
MESILIGILVMVALAIISLVLLQHGKGSDMGAAFGSGASNTVFGSQGSTSFLAKLTFSLVLVFFVICIILTGIARKKRKEPDC